MAKVAQQKNIVNLTQISILSLHKFFETLTLPGAQKEIAEKILKEIQYRLNY